MAGDGLFDIQLGVGREIRLSRRGRARPLGRGRGRPSCHLASGSLFARARGRGCAPAMSSCCGGVTKNWQIALRDRLTEALERARAARSRLRRGRERRAAELKAVGAVSHRPKGWVSPRLAAVDGGRAQPLVLRGADEPLSSRARASSVKGGASDARSFRRPPCGRSRGRASTRRAKNEISVVRAARA